MPDIQHVPRELSPFRCRKEGLYGKPVGTLGEAGQLQKQRGDLEAGPRLCMAERRCVLWPRRSS